MATKEDSRKRRHRGDIMSPEKRSALMSRIKSRDTGPERIIAGMLSARGFTWEGHPSDLPGRPDFVFRDAKLAVFVDGDFWHGWRFSAWKDKLSEKWECKIETNRRNDARNNRRLRRLGWKVIRIWEHQIEISISKCINRIMVGLDKTLLSQTIISGQG